MKKYGLIGYPLTHSFSKNYFSEKFKEENIMNCGYELYPLANIDLLPQLLMDNPDLSGLNVTIPYKESVIPFLNELDPTAKTVGAVNCIKITGGSGKPFLKGYNTDVFGFRQSIKPFLEIQHERALILGTGGGSRAVQYVLKEIGIDCFFATRDKTPIFFKNESEVVFKNVFEYSELNEHMMKAFKLIVNTTPVGMFPDTAAAPEIPYEYITPTHLLYDLIYNPAETEFLKRGKEKGAATVNGLSMLKQQAEEGWRIWNSSDFI
ncbi:MAG: Shikimate dehydrogenase [Bacteroidota bacterium]|jgi:shikimate dehydrogenase|nr:Shikimate dehydrogenase [Bacteroidota bacterium]